MAMKQPSVIDLAPPADAMDALSASVAAEVAIQPAAPGSDGQVEYTSSSDAAVAGAIAATQDEKLTAAQTRALSDDEFFAAYQAGNVKRREDAWTEENWEEVDACMAAWHAA